MLTQDEIQRIERIQFKGLKLDGLTSEQRVAKIQSRVRSRILMLVFNVLMIVLFMYSTQNGLSRLDGGWSIAVMIVFSVNTGLYLHQLSQLKRVKAHFNVTG